MERLTGTINGIGYSLKANALPLKEQELTLSYLSSRIKYESDGSKEVLEAVVEIFTRLAAYEDIVFASENLGTGTVDTTTVQRRR